LDNSAGNVINKAARALENEYVEMNVWPLLRQRFLPEEKEEKKS